MERVQATGKIKKRKAESQDNERLSKRLSLLNLERNGQKLYVPVEQPTATTPISTTTSAPLSTTTTTTRAHRDAAPAADDVMQVDDSKHKVYIYNLDDELSDSDTSDDGRLVFLPDIEKHLRDSRIPPAILANNEGELAGSNLQMVLYNIPSSLTVPEGQDSVRKAIIETRARARAKQGQNRELDVPDAQTPAASMKSHPFVNGTPAVPSGFMQTEPDQILEDDPDAMDVD
ncbi:hypothetical protein PVAG01_06342 [Phlyctema vagabunda]|uniref:Uncharacterized protein n=1 Tax=Phlyctema vagabunda TaxID=108571 RepID=A0ABR4PFS5_9HELO